MPCSEYLERLNIGSYIHRTSRVLGPFLTDIEAEDRRCLSVQGIPPHPLTSRHGQSISLHATPTGPEVVWNVGVDQHAYTFFTYPLNLCWAQLAF